MQNKGKYLAGALVMLASFALVLFASNAITRMLLIPMSCVGFSIMSMAMDATSGTVHKTLGSYCTSNTQFIFCLGLGTILGMLLKVDITATDILLRMSTLGLAVAAWIATYYATRYPVGKPLLVYVTKDSNSH